MLHDMWGREISLRVKIQYSDIWYYFIEHYDRADGTTQIYKSVEVFLMQMNQIKYYTLFIFMLKA